MIARQGLEAAATVPLAAAAASLPGSVQDAVRPGAAWQAWLRQHWPQGRRRPGRRGPGGVSPAAAARQPLKLTVGPSDWPLTVLHRPQCQLELTNLN